MFLFQVLHVLFIGYVLFYSVASLSGTIDVHLLAEFHKDGVEMLLFVVMSSVVIFLWF